MKTLLLSLALITLSTTAFSQSYKTNQRVDTLLYQQMQWNGAGCHPMYRSINLDSALFDYVSGLDFILEVLAIDSQSVGTTKIPGHVALRNGQVLNPGDKINLPLELRVDAGSISYALIIQGTPLVANETYPCSLALGFTLDACGHIIVMEADMSQTCTVGVGSGIVEDRSINEKLFAQVIGSNLEILFTSVQTIRSIEMLSLDGRTLYTTRTEDQSHSIPISGFANGLYLIVIKDQRGLQVSSKKLYLSR